MRCLVGAAAFLCVVSVNARSHGQDLCEDFCPPFVVGESVYGEIAGIRVALGWNKATSPPTVYYIERSSDAPVVLARTGSPDEAAASAAEFIDAHPDWFRVSSENFKFRAYTNIIGWNVFSWQFHRGVRVCDGSVDLRTRHDGRLDRLASRLFPEADLEGLSTDTAVSGERATEIALASQDFSVNAYTAALEKQISFVGLTPLMAWTLVVSDIGVGGIGQYRYLIDGQTGAVLRILVDGEDELLRFVRGNVNFDCKIDVADAVAILSALFLGGPELVCPDAADVNDDGILDITDAIYDLNYLFLGGPRPARPFPYFGNDVTPDRWVCPP